MKKIFTLVMLSILTVMNASAAETILWEGDLWISWEGDNTDDDHKQVSISGVADFADDQVMYVYLAKDTEPEHLFTKDYHQYRFDGDWDVNLIDAVDVVEDYVKVKFVVSSANKTALGAKTFNIHGHGIRVLRVTTEVAETPNAILWHGTATITNWSTGNLTLNLYEKGINTACKIYLIVEDGTNGAYHDMRIVNNNDWSSQYPSADYNHLQNRDANNIVTVSLSQDFINGVLASDYKQIVFWGNDFVIKGISTSKDALLQLNKGLLVNLDANGFATFSSAWKLNLANLPDGLEAYTGSLSGNTLSFVQKTTAVAAETGLLLKGTAWNPYKIPVTLDDAETVSGNALQANVVETSRNSDGSNSIYVMKKATTAGDLKFLKLTSAVNVPANRAYVLVTGAGAHELNVSFGDGETTGINAVKSDGFMMNGYYDLQGRKVAQPTKGLYIVNGKKVVIK